MQERKQILDLWKKTADGGQSAVLATVLRTEGSSYRLPGARLLLTTNGQHVGGISGGCLEEDVVKKAWWLTANGPILRRYDTTRDGELATDGFGLGCNGVIHVLLERLTPQSPSILPILESSASERKPAAIAHVLSPQAIGQRLVLDTAGVVSHNLVDHGIVSWLIAEAERDGPSRLLGESSATGVFLERIFPPFHLLVFGAGDDAGPLTRFAHQLGWRVSVFDGRSHYARREKFPEADLVAVRSPGAIAPLCDAWTGAVVMTHSYSQDLDILRSLAGQSLPYLGVLGPQKRTVQLLSEAGVSSLRSNVGLYAPMGLDIGADGPEQVALAVLSEIQAVINHRAAGSLRDRNGPIHASVSGESNTGGQNSVWTRSIVCA